VVQDQRPLPDELISKYVPGGSLSIAVTENVRVDVPFGSLAAVLTLVECYQANNRAGGGDRAAPAARRTRT
jgi:hypothetical protein